MTHFISDFEDIANQIHHPGAIHLPATRFPGQATDGLLANQLSHCIAIGR
jgi:hypothetical protein